MSLRGRLVLAALAVALVALVAADLITYSALHSFLYDRVDQSLVQAVAARAPGDFPRFPGPGGQVGSGPGVAAPGGSGAPVTVPAPEGQGENEPQGTRVRRGVPGVSFEVRDTTGTTVFGPLPLYTASGKAYLPAIPSHLSGFSGRLGGQGPDADDPVRYLDVPATTAGGPSFRVLAVREGARVVLVGAPLSDTTGTLWHLLLVELVVTAVALVAAGLLGWWLVRVGLRPLADVEDTAERIAESGLGQRVPGANDRTEVGRLARTINLMLGRIERAFAERDATEAQLRASEERLRRFVADASHELRTPLAAVSAYAELFERGAGDHPEDLPRVVRGIRTETARMGRLVEDLFLLARLDEGRPLEQVPVDVGEVAADAVHTAATVNGRWPVHLGPRPPAPVVVVGDEARLRQVVDNLLGNVRDHTPPGTPATVSVRTEGSVAVLQVADRGPGFPPGVEDRVFERFYRGDPSRARASGGTGLGLAIVAAVVAAHGGTVTAGATEGGGATVTVRLPLAAAGPGADPIPGDRRAEPVPAV
jgi:two-component system OmpR family sensor kinase